MDIHRLDGPQEEELSSTAINSSTVHLLDMATVGQPLIEQGDVTLKDIVVDCLPEDSTSTVLDGMMLVAHSLGEKDMAHTKETLPVTWKYQQEKLYSGMNELVSYVQLVDAGHIGYATLPKEEEATDHNTELECNLEENGPLRRLISALAGTSQNATPGFGLPSNITLATERDMLNVMQNPEAFSAIVAELVECPELLHDLGDLFYDQFLETKREDDINKAISAYTLAVKAITSDDARYGMYLSNGGIALLRRFELSGKLADIDQAISMIEIAITYTTESDASYATMLNDLGKSCQARFKNTGDLADIVNAISAYQRAVQLTPEGHPDMPSRLNNISISLYTRFEYTGDLVDIGRAISSQEKAIQLTPEGHTERPSWLNNLGIFFNKRFQHTGNLADNTDAISTQQMSIQLTPEAHTNMPSFFNNLGAFFQVRFERTSDLEDISRAISTHQRAVQLTPEGHENMASLLNNLGTCFMIRFRHTGDLADIDSAIFNLQVAIQLTPQGHANMLSVLKNLGSSFMRRFERSGNLADIASAISNQQKAVNLTPEGHASLPMRLNSLGISFQTRFEHTDDLSDIDNAISAQKRAIQLTPDGHATMPSWLHNLGTSLRARFKRTGDLANIDSAISTHQEAIRLTPEGHTNMASMLNNLGNSFQRRFRRTGDLADIASAISTQQEAVQLTPEAHPDAPVWLHNLGTSFRLRFKRTADLADISSAISTQQRAVHLTPDGHADMPMRLSSLGNSFQTRFKCTGDLEDIETAISTQKKAIQLTPTGHAGLPMLLNNLGNCFQRRFESTGENSDISSAINTFKMSIRLTPEGHPDLPMRLNNLGTSFRMRFERTDNLADIGRAISALQTAVRLTPEGHAEMTSWLRNLGISFLRRCQSTLDKEDLHDGISMLHRSATQVTGDLSQRFKVACQWATFSRLYDKAQSLDAFDVAIRLLPQVVGLEHTIHKRHQTLTNVSDITTSATAAAIEDNKLDTALTWLEQGRCLVWNQLNQLRTPTDALRAYNPTLAERFFGVARALEASGSRQEKHETFSEENMAHMISLQEESHTHVHLAKEWNELLQEIRRIPEFEDFLQPPQASKLFSRLPLDSPIVVFNIHEDRCDALALISTLNSPVHIRLETFSLDKATRLRDEMRRYLIDHHARQGQEAGRGTFRLRQEGVSVIYKILRQLWKHVAKPILDALAYSPRHSDHPRIWWCPTGPLAFLPIHAAGIYSKETASAGPCVSDYVVSSYTPTVNALLDKLKEAPTVAKETPTIALKPTSLLIISQPWTPGQSPIPGAKIEAYALKDMIGPPPRSLLLEDASATMIRVKEEMKLHSWVHFACHAIQDSADPLKSGMQLHDGRLEVLEIIKQTLPDADLAFLSACQTSTGDEKLSDEVVHLAAGMLAAGYRSVVATMWSIKDEYGPVVAKDFYSHILPEISELADRRLDSANAARALHYATQKIRKDLGDTEDALLTWVPYVHFGV